MAASAGQRLERRVTISSSTDAQDGESRPRVKPSQTGGTALLRNPRSLGGVNYQGFCSSGAGFEPATFGF